MKKWIAVMTLAASIAFLVSFTSTQYVAPKPDVAARAREVFRAKCAACHGPDLAKPEGRFGYVLDLRRIAANPEMVIPGSPDESELWVLVKRGEMPPSDAPDGPLTEVEKEIIRTWIESGASADN